jgi:hypothetical protein
MFITLKNTGNTTEVDDDFFYLEKFNWMEEKKKGCTSSYAVAVISGKRTYLHRIILGTPPSLYTDHKDRNGLNNKLSNLRVATKSQNAANIGLIKTNTSGFKGVHKGVRGNYTFWRAEITVNGKHMVLGQRKNLLEAVKLYDDAAKKYFGEFAKVNEAEKLPKNFTENFLECQA